MSDWKPDLYLAFEKERTQPSIDLTMRIEKENPNRIIDIGCGPGNSTNVLKSRWPEAEITGLDNSGTMIAKATGKYSDINWVCADASGDLSKYGMFDIVFSNAAIQWIPNQHLLLPNLFGMLNESGVLAVQAPYIANMPIHTELIKLAGTQKWSKQFVSLSYGYAVHPTELYYNILNHLTEHIDLWETDYYHIMNSHEDIVRWYKSTGLRPYLDCLTDEEAAEFLKDFENALTNSYPVQSNTKILFPFKRIFFIARKV